MSTLWRSGVMDSDDDLLALAGAGSDTEDEQLVKQDTPAPDSDVEMTEAAEAVDDKADSDDEKEPERPPYPLDGKYKDEADREYLLGLPELERESILYDRGQETQRYNERQYLKRRSVQTVIAASSEPKEVRASRKTRTGAASKLDQLRKQRQQRRRRDEDEYEESAEELSEEDEEVQEDSEEYEEPEEEERADLNAREPHELTLGDVNAAKWGKTQFARYCHYPDFAQVLRGCFVRVSIGFDSRRQQNTYVLAQVVDVEKCDPYTFGDRRTVDELLHLTHAGSERKVEMGMCSDGPVTADEFEKWKQEMEAKDISLPRHNRIMSIAKSAEELRNRILNADEITEMVERRQKLAGFSGSNMLLRRSALEEQKRVCLEQGDEEQASKVQEELDRLSSKRRRSSALGRKSALEEVSERNRKSNLASVRKAEILAQAERRRSGYALKADPFSRLRTTAKIFYDNKSDAPVAQVEAPDELPAQRVNMSALDDMIASIDIPIRITL